MRKRKTINLKRVTTRSITGMQKFLSASGETMNSMSEESLMEREETLQRLVDNFWGLDKDLKDRLAEQEQMAFEDSRSKTYEAMQRLIRQHEKWDQEFFEEQKMKKEQEREARIQQRLDHLRLVNSPMPIEEVLNSIWRLDEAEGHPLLHNIASLSLNSLYSSTNMKRLVGESQMGDVNADPSQLSLESVRMSLHLEGLQRSKEIIDQTRNNIRAALKDIYSDSKNKLDNKPLPLPLPSGNQNKPATQQTEKAIKKEVEKLKKPAPIAYNASLLGHPTYHWDQTTILQTVFHMLEKDNKGLITAESLQRVSHDPAIHELLQYTVLWSIIKKKEWGYFFKLMDNHEEPTSPATFAMPPLSRNPSREFRVKHLAPMSKNPSFRSTHSSQSNAPPPPKSVSYHRWMQLAESLTRETRVSVRRIRFKSEHEFLTNLQKFQHDYYDNDQHGIIRNYRLIRCLKVGDCVWALHRNGVRWLPAVVECIHTQPVPILSADMLEGSSWLFESTELNKVDSPVDGIEYSYDLWYPLSEQELSQSQLNSTSQQLLTLPSQTAAEGLIPKPYPDERGACSYAFDLIDNTSSGVVELLTLLSSMQSEDMKCIVNTSIVLTAIFTEKYATIHRVSLRMIENMKKMRKTKVRPANRSMPMLLNVFMDTFSTQPESDEGDEYTIHSEEYKVDNPVEGAPRLKEKVIDCVSKMDFLEFCDAVLNVLKYDIHNIRFKQ